MNYEYGAIGYIGKLVCLPLWKEIKDVNARLYQDFPDGKSFLLLRHLQWREVMNGSKVFQQ